MFSNIQPTLAVTCLICIIGTIPSQITTLDELSFSGQIVPFIASSISTGWLLADWSLLSPADYSDLFVIISTIYGGDGISIFALLDLRNRVLFGAGIGLNTQFGGIGEAELVTISNTYLPTHLHSLIGSKYSASWTMLAGGSQPFDQRQPFIGINYIIVLIGIYPSRNNGSIDPVTPLIGEVLAFAGSFQLNGSSKVDVKSLQIASNQALFSLLGTTYGGNGFSTFNLPDLRDRVIIVSGTSFTAGQTFGSLTTTLTVNEMPSHIHTLNS